VRAGRAARAPADPRAPARPDGGRAARGRAWRARAASRRSRWSGCTRGWARCCCATCCRARRAWPRRWRCSRAASRRGWACRCCRRPRGTAWEPVRGELTRAHCLSVLCKSLQHRRTAATAAPPPRKPCGCAAPLTGVRARLAGDAAQPFRWETQVPAEALAAYTGPAPGSHEGAVLYVCTYADRNRDTVCVPAADGGGAVRLSCLAGALPGDSAQHAQVGHCQSYSQ